MSIPSLSRWLGVGLTLLGLGLGCSTSKSGSSLSPSAGAAGGGDAGASGSAGAANTSAGSAGAAGSTPDAGGPGPVDAGIGGDAPPLTPNVTLHIAGDSTAAIFPATDATMRVGWGSVLQPFFGAGVTVDDAARSGRSSKSFIDEGFWAALKPTIKPGDYVFIQFAHNDEKVGDTARYTDPATTFRDYLKIYIADTRAAGGFAVLLTPISRRQFSGSLISPTHGAYPAAIIAVGQETNTPVIDMTEKTRVLLEGLGPTASIPLFATGDNTHLSAIGAPQVASLVVQGIVELGLPLSERLAPPAGDM